MSTYKFRADAASAFQATLRACSGLRWGALEANPATGVIVVRTPRPERYWDGTLTVLIVPDRKTHSRITISGAVQRTFSGAHASSEGAMGIAEMKLLVAIRLAVTGARKAVEQPSRGVPLASAQPGAVGSVADELHKLKVLLDDGVLSSKEFEAAKRRALS